MHLTGMCQSHQLTQVIKDTTNIMVYQKYLYDVFNNFRYSFHEDFETYILSFHQMIIIVQIHMHLLRQEQEGAYTFRLELHILLA